MNHGPTNLSLSTSRESIAVLAVMNELHAQFGSLRSGKVADYIPELERVDPDLFGIAVVTVQGEVFSIGDASARFTMQSLVTPFTYGIALARLGKQAVLEQVGVEPTGNPFNAIVLEKGTNRPMNPLVNAGAIAIASMLPGGDPTDRLNRVLDDLGRYVGTRPDVDMQVYMSERTTADRNRSIAYLMRNFGRLAGTLDEALDLYFQSCSVLVDAVDLATMAATLANGGLNPRTFERALDPATLRDVLTVMFTCGLFEESGQWAYRVGVPAKSGVSGGFMAVVPGVLGIAVYSPRLDSSGSSVRGQKVCESLTRRLGLHLFQCDVDRKPDRLTEEPTPALNPPTPQPTNP
ncbi:MAG: glutaminase A [Fimbriimonadaceae bacterium]|nr:glutaminase A [Fimbriimonadaceae bacterium]QYK55236.1 MAG: glutaminase A [Fimbriimonadaceae bacterium]